MVVSVATAVFSYPGPGLWVIVIELGLVGTRMVAELGRYRIFGQLIAKSLALASHWGVGFIVMASSLLAALTTIEKNNRHSGRNRNDHAIFPASISGTVLVHASSSMVLWVDAVPCSDSVC